MKLFGSKKPEIKVKKDHIMKRNCADLTVYDFIRCSFHKDFSVLFSKKSMFEPENEAQKQAIDTIWQGIIEEWAQLTENPSYKELLELMNEVIRLQDIVLKTDVALTVLNYKYHEESIEILKGLGYPVEFPKDDKQKYLKDAETCMNRLKGVKIQLEMAVKAITELQKGSENGQTENEFMDGVAYLGKFLGTPINIKNTSMYEYASYIRMNNKAAQKTTE
jgi:hypothetical protein